MPRLGQEALTAILDKGQKARTKSIQLNGVEFASELAKQLRTHADEMEVLYGDLKKVVGAEQPDENMISDLLKKYQTKKSWFDKAEVGVWV